jgi:hypothetical protein
MLCELPKTCNVGDNGASPHRERFDDGEGVGLELTEEHDDCRLREELCHSGTICWRNRADLYAGRDVEFGRQPTQLAFVRPGAGDPKPSIWLSSEDLRKRGENTVMAFVSLKSPY